MIAGLSLIGALLTIFGAGFGMCVLLNRGARELKIVDVVAVSWLLGTAAVSLSLWLFGLALRGPGLQSAVTALCLLLALSGVLHVRRREMQLRIALPESWIERALLVVLFLEGIAVFYLAFRHTLGWDGLLVWELKARYAYLNGGALPPAYFVDVPRTYTHPEYPLYIPFTQMWLYFWLGEPSQFWAKLIFPMFYCAGMVVLARAGEFISGRRWIGMMLAALLLFVPFLTRAPGGITVGYADVPLSFFYLAAVYFLVVFAEQNSRIALGCFIAFVSLLPWVKREGAILWVVIAGIGVWVIWRRRGIKAALIAILPGIGVIAGWRIYLAQMHAQSAADFVPVSAAVIQANLNRVSPILWSLLEEMARVERWNLLWFIALVAFFSVLLRKRNLTTAILAISTAAPLVLYSSTYLFSAWPNYLQHIESSLARLLLHVTPVALLSLAPMLRADEQN